MLAALAELKSGGTLMDTAREQLNA
jgi:hypothetical protein